MRIYAYDDDDELMLSPVGNKSRARDSGRWIASDTIIEVP